MEAEEWLRREKGGLGAIIKKVERDRAGITYSVLARVVLSEHETLLWQERVDFDKGSNRSNMLRAQECAREQDYAAAKIRFGEEWKS